MLTSYKKSRYAAFIVVFCLALGLRSYAQSGGSSISGTVLDPSGAVVTNASVEIHNAVSGYDRTTITDSKGQFIFPNVPFNPYHMTVTASGFAQNAQDVEIRSTLGVNVKVSLAVARSTDTVTVEAGADLVENDPISHTDVSKELFDKLPLESQSSSLSSLVTLATAGVAADSNGLFHGLGDHAENSFSLDGQPITDQQSKVFSNQVPLDSVQSLEVIQGAPPAEYGGKTSLIINVTTRSGQGMTTPHGDVTASYGSFGTSNAGFNLGYGNDKWGNFISVSGLNSGRFLDPPEFAVMNDRGNQENVFDRVDYKFSSADSILVNLGFTRSWFQNPNSFDQQFHNVDGVVLTDPLTGSPLGRADQVSQIKTYNIAPMWTHLLSSSAAFSLGGYVRKDQYNYYPSANLFDDLSPDLQGETVAQNRKLANVGVRSYFSYVKGIHNLKTGGVYEQTFLTEDDRIGIVDPTLVPGITPSCLDPVTHQPISGTACAILAPYDLTGGGGWRHIYPGSIPVSRAHRRQGIGTVSPGYDHGAELGVQRRHSRRLLQRHQPRPASRASPRYRLQHQADQYGASRFLCANHGNSVQREPDDCQHGMQHPTGFLATLVPPPGVSWQSGPIRPGHRNEFHAGLQQAFGRYLVIDGEYIWKYTHNGYDFGVVGGTPITSQSSGQLQDSRIRNPRQLAELSRTFGVCDNVQRRRALLPAASSGVAHHSVGNEVFRIDHDEVFNETTHLQYQPLKRGPWFASTGDMTAGWWRARHRVPRQPRPAHQPRLRWRRGGT